MTATSSITDGKHTYALVEYRHQVGAVIDPETPDLGQLIDMALLQLGQAIPMSGHLPTGKAHVQVLRRHRLGSEFGWLPTRTYSILKVSVGMRCVHDAAKRAGE